MLNCLIIYHCLGCVFPILLLSAVLNSIEYNVTQKVHRKGIHVMKHLAIKVASLSVVNHVNGLPREIID